METYSYLNDVPLDKVMNDDDTIVIGKKTRVNGQTRYLARVVTALELKRNLTSLVLEEADLDNHIAQMDGKIELARKEALKAESSASAATEAIVQAKLYSDKAKELAAEADQSSVKAKDEANQSATANQSAQSASEQAALSRDTAVAAADKLATLEQSIAEIEKQSLIVIEAGNIATAQASIATEQALKATSSELNASSAEEAAWGAVRQIERSQLTRDAMTTTNAVAIISANAAIIKNAHWNTTLSERVRVLEK